MADKSGTARHRRSYAEASCPRHATWPKTRAAFWPAKLTGNKARDCRVNRALREHGWKVVRVWEHELRRKDEARLLRKLRAHLCPRCP